MVLPLRSEPEATEPRVIWRPYPGSQSAFLRCPYWEVLYEGERGPGKTDALLADFARTVGQGFGSQWRGILFRRTFPELSEIVVRSKELFPRIFPGARFLANGPLGFTWIFPDGEFLRFRQLRNMDDARKFLGHQYPWIGFEELVTWPVPDPYEAILACSRRVDPKIPLRVRSTTNPWGPGHGWVKKRFVDPMPERRPYIMQRFHDETTGQEVELTRCRIHGKMAENLLLRKHNPQYIANLMSISDPALRAAWLEGSWEIKVGGMFVDLWRSDVHEVEPFKIPDGWYVDRGFDWGLSKPFCVLWFAEANGEEVTLADGTVRTFPRGTVFVIAEWYGWNGNENEGCRLSSGAIAKGINDTERERLKGGQLLNGQVIHPGPADSSIYDVGEDGQSIADKMAQAGVRWTKANKGPGSRVTGWAEIRERLEASLAQPMEAPGVFVFNTCRHLIRTLKLAPRDERNADDIDTNSEDHPPDTWRYRLLTKRTTIETQTKRMN